MKQKRFLVYLPAFCLLALALRAQGHELKLGSASGEFNTNVNIPLTLSTTGQVQGLVAVFDWNSANGTGVAFNLGAFLATAADTVVTDVAAGHMVLGAVFDSNPNDPGSPEILGPGTDIPLGTAVIRCGSGPTPSTTPIVFRDGTYGISGGPRLDNIIVIGGLSFGAQEGLALINGEFRCIARPDRLTLGSGGNPTDGSGNCGTVQVLMSNNGPVEGFVTAVCHPAGLALDSIALGPAASAADFFSAEGSPGNLVGTFGVVMDLIDPQPSPPVIAPGSNQHIATYRYCCRSLPAPTSPPACHTLRFCDNQIGSPPKENLIVVGGRSISAPSLELVDTGAQFCCNPARRPAENTPELCSDGIDNDGDGLTDCDDPDCCRFRDICPPGEAACPAIVQSFLCGGRNLSQDSNKNGIPDVTGSRGSAVEVCFYVVTPEDHQPGHAQFDHIQGFSMAVQYCCDIRAVENLDIRGTILEALGAEFVSIQVDNNPNDGDGCELIIGVLIDALPPFDGGTIPPSPDPQRVGCVIFNISEEAKCDSKCPIEFVDGLNGRGRIPIKNLMSLENHSFGPALMPCEVCVKEQERFFRGDCNFSLMGSMAVDIADAAAVISFLFLPGSWQFQPGCLDACDCNDDGRVDLADAICILQYLFQGGRTPPAPGPGFDPNTGKELPPGPDLTEDKLDCVLGRDCVLVPH
jgi:hypothetical protein